MYIYLQTTWIKKLNQTSVHLWRFLIYPQTREAVSLNAPNFIVTFMIKYKLYEMHKMVTLQTIIFSNTNTSVFNTFKTKTKSSKTEHSPIYFHSHYWQTVDPPLAPRDMYVCLKDRHRTGQFTCDRWGTDTSYKQSCCSSSVMLMSGQGRSSPLHYPEIQG